MVLAEAPSTNDLGKRIARNYLAESARVPAVDIVAWGQSAGRGRLAPRRWSSPPGAGVYLTMVRDIRVEEGLERVPLAVAVAVGETLDRHLAGRCRLRWPNDLMVGGRKIGGILIEVISRGDGAAAVIGVGINHRGDPDALDAPGATTLERAVAGAPLPDLVGLVAELARAVEARLGAERATLLAAYRALSAHRPGDALTVRIGGDARTGVFQGFDEHGFLCLDVDGARHRVPAGEVIDDDV